MSIGLTSRRLNTKNGDNIVEYASYITAIVFYKIDNPEIVKDGKFNFDRNLFENVRNVMMDPNSYAYQIIGNRKAARLCTKVNLSGKRAHRVAAYVLFLPDNAPPSATNLEVFLNSVQVFADGRRSALAEEHIITFPDNYPLEVQKSTVNRLVTEQFVSKGLTVFAAFHKPDILPSYKSVKSPVTGIEYEKPVDYKFDYTHSCKTHHVHLLVFPRKFNEYGSFSNESTGDKISSKADYIEHKRLQRIKFENYIRNLTKEERAKIYVPMSKARKFS